MEVIAESNVIDLLKIIMDKEFAELGINKKETKKTIVKKETKKINSNSYSIVVGTFKYQK